MPVAEDAGDITVDHLRLDGQRMNTDVATAITAADLDRPIDGAPTLSLTLEDPKRQLLRSGIFDSRITCQIETYGFAYELAQVRKTGDGLQLTFEDLVVASLRRHTDPLKVAAGTMSRADFVVQRLLAEEPWIKPNVAGTARQLAKVELARGNPDRTTGAAADQTPEDSWTAGKRVLGEIGWRLFVGSPNQLNITNDEWIMRYDSAYRFAEFVDGVDVIDFDWDSGKPVATATITVRAKRYFAAPGVPVDLADVGLGSGKWIISDIKQSLFSSLQTVTVIKPQPLLPEPEPPAAPPATASLGAAEGTPSPGGDAGTAGGPGSGTGQQVRPGGVSPTGYIWPVHGTITSGFGTRDGRMHEGLDIAVPVGTPVLASRPGTVTFAGNAPGYGYVVYLSHAGDPNLTRGGQEGASIATAAETRYGHLSRFNCRRGQQLQQGDTIGWSGGQPGTPGAGDATGPHLHFEIRIGGAARNPNDFLFGTGNTNDYLTRGGRAV